MATASTLYTVAIPRAAIVANGNRPGATAKVNYINGLNSFCGLKAENKVSSLSFPVSTDQCFAKIVSFLRVSPQGKRGGALSSTCNAVAEIFRVAAVMPGLVLVGVAVGFVLLRLEASVEEE